MWNVVIGKVPHLHAVALELAVLAPDAQHAGLLELAVRTRGAIRAVLLDLAVRAPAALLAGLLALAVRTRGANRAVVLDGAMGAGRAGNAHPPHAPVRAPHALHAVLLHLPVRARSALLTALFQLPVRARRALLAGVFLLPMPAPLKLPYHGSHSVVAVHFPSVYYASSRSARHHCVRVRAESLLLR